MGDLDFLDHLSSIVTGLIAIGGLALVVARRRRSWWDALASYWKAHQDAGVAGYALDTHVPRLLTVYVPRRLGNHPADDVVLFGRGHVLLVGPPGSGKTALVRQTVAASARRWLRSEGRLRRAPRGPVVITIPATDLIHETLRDACRPWLPDIDRAPVPRRGLVILIDGLHGVVGAAQRSTVINKLAAEAEHPQRRWRLVVTTRPLDERELRALNGFTAYDLMPFTGSDVALLARRWFVADDARAERLTTWLETQRLGVSARGPLLTTVAATLWDTGLESSAPTPAALLDRFVDTLLEARAKQIGDVLAEIRRPAPALADWLEQHQRGLLTIAARACLTGASVVTGTVKRLPVRAAYPQRDQLRRLLLATDVFQADRDRLVPVWPDLAEFLAADPYDADPTPQEITTGLRDLSSRPVTAWRLDRARNSEALLAAMLGQPGGPVELGRLVSGGRVVPAGLRRKLIIALLSEGELVSWPTAAELRDVAGDTALSRAVRQAAQLALARL